MPENEIPPRFTGDIYCLPREGAFHIQNVNNMHIRILVLNWQKILDEDGVIFISFSYLN